jgi:hypothetical protein
MPYIKPERREQVSRDGKNLPAVTTGELNFQITECITDYMCGQTFNYQLINNVLGALEGAKAEFYRRVAVPYEDLKIKENGDVW